MDYFFNSKSHVPQIIKAVRIQYNANIKRLRCDRGTEQLNETVQDFLANHGIGHETSAPVNAEWHYSEANNRIIGNSIRT